MSCIAKGKTDADKNSLNNLKICQEKRFLSCTQCLKENSLSNSMSSDVINCVKIVMENLEKNKMLIKQIESCEDEFAKKLSSTLLCGKIK